MSRVATNVPQEPLRWSVLRAAEEYELDQVTLRKRLVAAKQEPGEDSCYSTSQIVSAIYSDSKALRDREVKEKGDNWAIRNQILRGQLLDRKSVENGLDLLLTAASQVIKGSNLLKKDQKDVISNLANCVSVLDDVARKQSSQIETKEEE